MPSKPVNRPNDPKEKEQSINQKLQLYGIYHGIKRGKMPSNKQCDIALNSALQSNALSSPSRELSEEGQTLVKDLRNVIDQARKLIMSKNEGQLLQDLIWEAQHLGSVEAKKPGATVDKDGARQDGNQAMDGLRTLGTLLITNGEFRKILSDALVIVRDMANDASQHAPTKIRPSEEQLSQIDQPAEENEWHEKPAGLPTEQLKSRFKNNKGDRASEFSDSATGNHTAEVSKESTKDRKRQASGKTKEYLSEKMPPERRDQAIRRLKKMVMEIQGHTDYQKAIETLLSLAEKYARQTNDISQQGTGSVREVGGNQGVKTVETNLRTLLERFANSTSLDGFFDSLETIYKDADKDRELKGWFKNVDTFIRKSLQEQGFVMGSQCNREWNHLYDHGQYLLQDRYKAHTDHILDEIKFFSEQYNKDAQNKAFGQSMEKLLTDLGHNTEGKVNFKKHLLKDIGYVILPSILAHIHYMPIPRIEFGDPTVDVVVENLVIESDNLMPNILEFGSDNYFRWGRQKLSSKQDNKMMISASGIQADLTDVSYYIKKKAGFPSISDKGLMDISLGGKGLGFKIDASIAQKEDNEHFVKLDKVSISISNMDIKLQKSKHKLLFKTFKPLLFRVIRPVLQKVLEQKIREAFINGDSFFNEVHTEAKRAQESAQKNNPEDETSIYSRHLEIFRSKMSERKKKSQEETAKRDSKVEATANLRDSQFPEIKLPGGISTKATEYVELAEKGERWESPIFSIGNASESTDIPKSAAITRKDHGTKRTADRYPSHGFSGDINQAFNKADGTVASNGSSKKVANGSTIVDGPLNAFIPQNA
ncbi:uncharacterized protein EURHEDRAFT_514102 [Aspergillus ruber CBS 135680]|uniref:Bactericidal permeability-increasing protein n=1 Tax=Aspergillus ruber (strain CBS 135680) TaxID=1388766 RepID=A0A017SJD0_ASPRC|nr:uncharacterized protein EURHEDRAFT_514102 [Aspergillus ruber CBS 135680]EYE96876.1 hypothetical protein EURHEDRAFT_514102 [Aspergillus ruber CBS 135680]